MLFTFFFMSIINKLRLIKVSIMMKRKFSFTAIQVKSKTLLDYKIVKKFIRRRARLTFLFLRDVTYKHVFDQISN